MILKMPAACCAAVHRFGNAHSAEIAKPEHDGMGRAVARSPVLV